MSSINRLGNGTPASDSQIPFLDTPNGRDAKASLADFARALQELLTPQGTLITQYSAPNATGFNVQIAPPTDGAGIYLLLTPLAGYAAGTVTLPAKALCVDGQELLVTSTQSVAALTVAGNGATVNGAPTALTANGFFRLRYDGVNGSWYRVG
jgi:hypothetical protein